MRYIPRKCASWCGINSGGSIDNGDGVGLEMTGAKVVHRMDGNTPHKSMRDIVQIKTDKR